MKPKHISVTDLGELLGVSKGAVVKRLRREGVVAIKLPVCTDGGIQLASHVTREYAESLVRVYRAAKQNTLIVGGCHE